jgi:hypothetical protein
MSCDEVTGMYEHCQEAWTSIPGRAIDILSTLPFKTAFRLTHSAMELA